MANIISPQSNLDRLLNSPNQNKDKSHSAELNEFSPAGSGLKNPVPQDVSTISAAMFRQAEQAYSYSQTMSLQLTTKEGDKVSVDFRQLYAQYQSYKEAMAGQQDPTGVRYFESREQMEVTAFEERFAFSVEGDLNEDELAAIFDVFEKVDKLANQFYEGNIEDALQEAMKMEIDFGQLQSMQLNLTQSEMSVSRQKQAVASEYGAAGEGAKEKATVAQLPDYLQKWQLALESLDQWFDDAQGSWNELMAGVTSQRFGDQDSAQGWFERVSAFHNQLVEMARAKENANGNDPVNETPAEVTPDVTPEIADVEKTDA